MNLPEFVREGKLTPIKAGIEEFLEEAEETLRGLGRTIKLTSTTQGEENTTYLNVVLGEGFLKPEEENPPKEGRSVIRSAERKKVYIITHTKSTIAINFGGRNETQTILLNNDPRYTVKKGEGLYVVQKNGAIKETNTGIIEFLYETTDK